MQNFAFHKPAMVVERCFSSAFFKHQKTQKPMGTTSGYLTGGDGLKRGADKQLRKRTPVPSARTLATRPQSKNDNVKLKLEDALNQLSSPKSGRLNRKRSQTMAEITPSKRRTSSNVKLSREGVETKSPPRKEDASRRVYQQLLLNAWRRRRVQVATLTDSSRQLQTQVDQLQIQVDVLHQLRESESQKRLEKASETERLRHEKNVLVDLVKKLRNEATCMENKIISLQQRIEEMSVNMVNIKNELLSAKSEVSAYEIKLQNECHNGTLLENQKLDLLNKIEEYNKASAEQLETIRHLEQELESVEKNLDTVNLNNSNLEETKSELEIKLERERNVRDDLEQQFIKSRIREEKLEKKVHELKKNVNLLNEIKRKILEDNSALKNTLKELEVMLKEEKGKTWWRSAAKTMLNTLHNAAYIMLPAYSKPIDTYTPLQTSKDDKL